MERQAIINELMKTYGWQDITLRVALRAQFRCEYCDREMYHSIEDHDALQLDLDHIVPKDKWREGEHDDNLAASCRVCNFLKHTLDPRDQAQPNLNREELIKRVREQLKPLRDAQKQKMASMRVLIDRLLTVSDQTNQEVRS